MGYPSNPFIWLPNLKIGFPCEIVVLPALIDIALDIGIVELLTVCFASA